VVRGHEVGREVVRLVAQQVAGAEERVTDDVRTECLVPDGDVGLPTLRLIRFAIGSYTLDGLAPGEWREVPTADAWRALGRSASEDRSRS